MPQSAQELGEYEFPAENENPFFCLLEDDKLVTALDVRLDRLLKPPKSNTDEARRLVHIVITADIRPYEVTMFNLSFAS
ncbi:MAG: hypothetical protein GY789_30365 [Hyphomicrobiales bacterium]|nr:hypothetical protein [Hyphomicrobiales bacterium]MCP5002243.1 hypothetical protein [Hyphomicrobiales bacterium]